MLLIGLIAVTTGINGLYVFLSAGLGGFIVSGLLSEQAIKNCTVGALTGALADAGTPFALNFSVVNTSRWFAVFAVESLFMLERPRFRLIAHAHAAVAATRLAWLAPASTQICTAMVAGLPRGEYQRLRVLQLTIFPFGILEKFKLSELPTAILIAPRLDTAWQDELRLWLRAKLSPQAAEREFHGHRPYVTQAAQAGRVGRALAAATVAPTPPRGGQGRQSRRDLDWRKNAGKPESAWVVRHYEAPADAAPVRLEVPWSYIAGLPDSASYEAMLVRIRTVMAAIGEYGRLCSVDFGTGPAASGAAALTLLARLPAYAQRHQGVPVASGAAEQATAAGLRLRLRLRDCVWADGPAARGAG